MTADALRLIEQLRDEITRVGAANFYQYSGVSPEFSTRLETLEPFRAFHNGWAFGGDGSGRIATGLAGRWVVNRLLMGAAPNAIIRAAAKLADTNSYTAMEVRAVKGIKVAQKERLTDTAYLIPNGELPQEWARQQSFGNDMLGPTFPSDTVSPAILPRVDGNPPEFTFDMTTREAREHFADHLRLALGLASGGPVEMPHTYTTTDLDCSLGGSASLSHRPSGTMFGNERGVSVPAAMAYVGELARMDSVHAIELSLNRLLRSRMPRSLEDRIIDLGMAAEIALMHSPKGAGDGKSEITNKISTRGAWLLGPDVHTRQSVADTLTALYTARSLVVHTGVAKANVVHRIAEFDDVVRDVLISLLSRGAFPDWKRLVLGSADTGSPTTPP